MMQTYIFSREQWLPRPLEDVFGFFSRPENLQVITPPWLNFRIVECPSSLKEGSLIRYRLRLRRLPVRWTSEITEWKPPFRFVDRQLSGPYRLWNHEHDFAAERGGTRIHDRVTYALPFGIIGRLAHRAIVESDVQRIFDFRADTMRNLFQP